MVTPYVAAPALSEEEDVLTSIRTVRELLNQEFGRDPSRNSTDPLLHEEENSWKTQLFQQKQAHYEEKLQLEAKLEVQRQQLSRLQQQVELSAREAETERGMRKTLEETLESHNRYTQTLTKQLEKIKDERKTLEDKLEGFHQAVDDGQSAVAKERSTWEELIQQTRLEKDRAWKNAGEEEAGRLRAESQAKELQKSVKLMQMRLQDAQHQSEQVAKQHAQEVALAKKAANQKIAHLQDQIQKLKKAKEEGADASESDLTIKALRLNVQKLEEEVASIKSELQKTSNERERDVAKHGIAVGRLKEQLEESKASRSKLSEELEKVQHDLEVAKRSTGSASGSGAVSPVTFSAVHAKRAKMIQNFEKSVANDSNVVDSLVAQIRVMKKAQPSKKVKEGLAAKEKALEEKRESHIKTLEKIEKLQTQQSTELHQELDKVTAEVEAARKAWLACEQQLLDTADAATRGNLQAKTDAAAMRFSVARRRWQAVKSELSNLLTQVSENRGKIAELRNPDDGDAATTTTRTLVGNQVDVSTGSHQPPTKRGSSQSGRRPQTKRQKTGSS